MNSETKQKIDQWVTQVVTKMQPATQKCANAIAQVVNNHDRRLIAETRREALMEAGHWLQSHILDAKRISTFKQGKMPGEGDD